MINDGPFRKGGNFLEKKENRKLGEIKAVEWNHGSNLDHDLRKILRCEENFIYGKVSFLHTSVNKGV